MSNLIRKAEKAIMTLGLFGIMLSLAGALAAAPSASASSLDNSAGVDTAASIQAPSATGKLGVYAIDTATGARVAGAQVVVVDVVTGRSVVKGLTRADGSYSTALPAGAYKVAVFARGYKQQSEAAKIAPGQATIIKIGIQPLNSIGLGNSPAPLQ